MNPTALATVLLGGAVLVQTAVLSRLPLPWGIVGDLVVVTLVAVALRAGPTIGAVAGFGAGLALDVLPPADAELGRHALVLCLTGYLVGLLPYVERRARLLPFAAVAAAAAGAGAGTALLGLFLGDPRVSWAAVALAVPAHLVGTVLLALVALPVLGWLWRRLTADEDRVDLGVTARWGGGPW